MIKSRASWTKKEEALRSRYAQSIENLTKRTKPLLSFCDHVLIQNQTGLFPNKWGKSGSGDQTFLSIHC